MKPRQLEGNCSNPTAINVCKRRLLTCCHLYTCSRFGLSSSPNHRLSCVIIDQSHYWKFITPSDTTCGHFITPTDTTCGPSLAKSRFCLVYTIYIYSIYARTTMMPPRVLASGPKPCGGNQPNVIVFVVVSSFNYFAFNCFLNYRASLLRMVM